MVDWNELWSVLREHPALSLVLAHVQMRSPWLVPMVLAATVFIGGVAAPWISHMRRALSAHLLLERRMSIHSTLTRHDTMIDDTEDASRANGLLIDAVLQLVARKYSELGLLDAVRVRGSLEWRTNDVGQQYQALDMGKTLNLDERTYLRQDRIHIHYSEDVTYNARDSAPSEKKKKLTLRAYGSDAQARLDVFLRAALQDWNARRSQRSLNKGGGSWIWRPRITKRGDVGYTSFKLLPGYRITPAICPCLPELTARIEHINALDGTPTLASTSNTSVPHKATMGILLHGPAGTGKTTFVKALAEALGGRHVVCVNLAMYENKPHDLANLLLNGTFLDDDGDTKRFALSQLLFCLEECDEYRRLLTRPSDNPAAPPCAADDDNLSNLPKHMQFDSLSQLEAFQSKRCDRLTFHRLLELLDGIVDTPGRVIVANTNCPESLDPALRRPGRLGDLDIHLGNLSRQQLAFCLAERFGEYDFSGSRLDDLDGRITLAMLQCVMAHCETPAETLHCLAQLGRAET